MGSKKNPQKQLAAVNRQPTLSPEMSHVASSEVHKTNPGNTLLTMSATAYKLFQEAKAQLKQSGNIKTTIKRSVINCLTGMYEIVLRLNESRQTLQLQLEKAKSQHTEKLLRREQGHATRLESLAESFLQEEAKKDLQEIKKEVDAISIVLTDLTKDMTIRTNLMIANESANKMIK